MAEALLMAHTKYTDLRGTIAIDFADQCRSFRDFLETTNFDFETYHPYAYSFEMGEATFKPLDLTAKGYFTVHAVSKADVGTTEDQIREAAMKNDGAIPVHRFSIGLSAQQLVLLFKRLQIVFVDQQGRSSHAGLYEDIEEEHDLTYRKD